MIKKINWFVVANVLMFPLTWFLRNIPEEVLTTKQTISMAFLYLSVCIVAWCFQTARAGRLRVAHGAGITGRSVTREDSPGDFRNRIIGGLVLAAVIAVYFLIQLVKETESKRQREKENPKIPQEIIQ